MIKANSTVESNTFRIISYNFGIKILTTNNNQLKRNYLQIEQKLSLCQLPKISLLTLSKLFI